MRPRPRRAVLLALALLVGPACSDAGGSGHEDTARRVAAVREARQVVAAPAEQLGAATSQVQEAVVELANDPRLPVADQLDVALDELTAATTELDGLDLAESTPDVAAATDAVARAVRAAERLADHASVVATAGRRVAEVDTQLEELTAAWDEPGSRSELAGRLGEVADAAEALVAQRPEGCGGPVRERNAAARFVAEASRDLQQLAAAYDGTAYDDRRAELDEAPYGRIDGAPRRLAGLGAAASTPCPAVAEASAAAEDVDRALEDLEEALNPSDLASRRPRRR